MEESFAAGSTEVLRWARFVERRPDSQRRFEVVLRNVDFVRWKTRFTLRKDLECSMVLPQGVGSLLRVMKNLPLHARRVASDATELAPGCIHLEGNSNSADASVQPRTIQT